MASKVSYTIVAILGIGAATGAAWWYQSKPKGPTEITANAGAGAGATASAVAASGAAPRPAGVEVAKVERARLQDDAQAVGSLKSRQSVMLRPEVAGRVKEIGFTDGQRVRKGQKLVQLDDILQRAEIKQSAAQVSIATANHKRNQELVAQNFVTQRVLDESSAALQVAEAQLALSCARLSRMAVLAPFDGTVGLRNINIGDYVKDGADLINLEDIGSMFVDFRLPERFQGKLKLQQPVEMTLDAFPGRSFKARIEALDPLLDANGRSVGVRALLPNTMGEPAREAGGRGPGGPGGPGAAGGPPGGNAPGAGGAGAAARLAGAGSGVATATAPGPRPGGAAGAPGSRPGGGRPGAVATGPGAAGGAVAVQVAGKDADGCPVDSTPQLAADGPVRGPGTAGGSGGAGGRPAGAGGATAGGRAVATGANSAAGAAVGSGGGNPTPLRPGMFARVNTVFSINEAALMVPEEAIVPQGGRQFVIKVVPPEDVPGVDKSKLPEGVKFVSLRQEVRLGVRRAGKVELVSGVEEGQTVVVAGQQRLQRDGSPLRVLEIGARPGGPGGPTGPGSAPGGQAGGATPTAAAPAASAASAAMAPANPATR